MTDTVVIGAGNAALCAAIAAAEQGARVVVLERAPESKRGGNSWFTDGAIRFAHEGMRDVRPLIPGMDDDEAGRIDLPPYPAHAYWKDLMRVSNGRVDPVVGRALVDRSLDTMRWLQQQGVPFTMLYDNQSFEAGGRYRFWGGLHVRVKNKGVGLIEALFHRADAVGVEVWYGARAVRVGRVPAGFDVAIETGGDKPQIIRARTVVFACGGFEADAGLRAQHLGQEWEGAIVRGTEFNTGEGLRLALGLGAVRHGDWPGCHAVATDAGAPAVGDFGKPGDIYKKHSYPLGIIVNARGERFVDEGADFRNYTYARYGREVLKQPGRIAYQIFDSRVAGLLRSEYGLPETSRVEARSLRELAGQLEIETDRFLETVAAYNAAVQDGECNPEILDGKTTEGIDPPKSNWAQRIDRAPFLAFPVRCGITFTFGGVRVSERSEVLDENGGVIEGLYAAGEMVGGLFYGNYPGGAGLMSGATFGRLAGLSAGRLVQSPRSA